MLRQRFQRFDFRAFSKVVRCQVKKKIKLRVEMSLSTNQNNHQARTKQHVIILFPTDKERIVSSKKRSSPCNISKTILVTDLRNPLPMKYSLQSRDVFLWTVFRDFARNCLISQGWQRTDCDI